MVKSFEVFYLKPESTHFTRQGDTLSLTVSEDNVNVHYPRVVLRLCFPVSSNSTYVSVRDANDEKQAEIGVIADWTQLDPDDREAVAAELRLHYFVPKIHRVHDITEELGFLYWTVETDKGKQEFVMRNSIINYTREIGPGHWLFIDVNQARHEIPDVFALDKRSQKLLQQYLSLS